MDADRLTYAAFPPALKAAMKTAAHRNAWCRETWAMQTALIQDALVTGRVLEATLIAGYSLKPPENALEGANAPYPLPCLADPVSSPNFGDFAKCRCS